MTSQHTARQLPAWGILIERIVLTFPSQPSMLIAVAVEKRRAGPTHKSDLKYASVKELKTRIHTSGI